MSPFSRSLRAIILHAATIAIASLALERASFAEEPEEVRVRGASQASGFVARAREGETPRETTDAASLAETLPGVHVRRLGADDGFATLSIRGSGSSQVAVLMAGVPLTGGSDPTLDLGSLPVWPGVQIRAYRTFAPASFGAGSLGGTLVLEPPRASTEPRTETQLSYGSFGAARMRAADSRPLGDGFVTTALSASRSDDEFDVFVPGGAGDGTYLRRRNAGHAQASALVSVVRPIPMASGKRGALTLTLIGQARRQELPGTTIDPTPFDRLDTTRLVPVMELSLPSERGAFRVRAYGRRDDQSLRAPTGTIAPAHEGDAFIAAGGAIGWRGTPSESTRVDVQFDGGGERFAPGTYVGSTPEGARRASAGVGTDLGLRLSRAVELAATGRVDARRDTRAGGGETSDVRPTGHVGAEINEGIFSAATHAGFTARPPAFLELYGNRGAFLSNPDLATESAFTVDVGARVRPRMGKLRFDIAATTFATFAEDLITFVPVGAFGRARAENIGRARILGVEGELSAKIDPVELRVVYTGLDPRNLGEGACTAVVGRCDRPLLPGRPVHDLVVDGAWRVGPARVRYGVDFVSGIAADLQGTVEVPARVLQSAGVRLDVPGAPGLSLSAEVKNLFDVRVVSYEGVRGSVLLPIGDAWAYPLPGRTAFAVLKYRM